MSSSLSLPDIIAGAAAHRRALVARTLPVTQLDAQVRDAAFRLFAHAYENVSRERFEHDLDAKQHVILLHDRASGALKGFSTVLVRSVNGPHGTMTVVFSGDTVIDREYWGQKQLQLAFLRLMATLKLRAPWRPLSWFLLSKGWRTYLLLANAFPRSVPRAGLPDDPELRAVLDQLAGEQFGTQYDRDAGVVRYADARERVRDGLAPVTNAVLANRHARFFVERNPEHAAGVELACLADVRLLDLARAALRFTGANLARHLRGTGARA